MLAQKIFRLVGNLWSAEQYDNTGLSRLKTTSDLQRDIRVPDIGGESDDIGIDKLLDRNIHMDSLIDGE